MQYYISNSYGSFTGPHTKHQLLNAGLKRDTLVWREGFTTWYPAYQLTELSDIIASTPLPLAATPTTPSNLPPAMPASKPAMSVRDLAKQSEIGELQAKVLPKAKTAQKPMAKPAQKPVGSPVQKPAAKPAQKPVVKPAKKPSAKEITAKNDASKKNGGSKYDHPVSPWFNESIWLLAFVIIHVILALTDMTTFEYIYLDILGAILCITGIVIGSKIKSLNKVSYAKNSVTRNQAEKLSKFNGFLVSATAAAGFLIILYQSAHYVYVC